MNATIKYTLLALLSGVSSLIYADFAHAEYKENYVGDMDEYEAEYEDTLVHLARKYGLGFVELRAANPKLDPWIPGDGADVIIPSRHLLPNAPRQGIVINLPEMRVFAYVNGDNPPSTYPIGIGREGLATPTGETSIVRKMAGPTWRPTERMRKEDPKLPASVPPGPDNPLGTHALYLGWPTYAIHGTQKPYGIGRRVSSGCIRMYPEDIIKFFEKIPVGTKVRVVNQPIKVAWIDDELYLEAHPDMEQAIKMEESGEVEEHEFSDKDLENIMNVAGQYSDLLNWPRIRMALKERSGYPVKIAKRFDNVESAKASEEHAENVHKVNVDVDVQQKPEVLEKSDKDVRAAVVKTKPENIVKEH